MNTRLFGENNWPQRFSSGDFKSDRLYLGTPATTPEGLVQQMGFVCDAKQAILALSEVLIDAKVGDDEKQGVEDVKKDADAIWGADGSRAKLQSFAESSLVYCKARLARIESTIRDQTKALKFCKKWRVTEVSITPYSSNRLAWGAVAMLTVLLLAVLGIDLHNATRLAEASGLAFTDTPSKAFFFAFGFVTCGYVALRFAIGDLETTGQKWLLAGVRWLGVIIAISSAMLFGYGFGSIHGNSDPFAPLELGVPVSLLTCLSISSLSIGLVAIESFIKSALEQVVRISRELTAEYTNLTSSIDGLTLERAQWLRAIVFTQGAIRYLKDDRAAFRDLSAATLIKKRASHKDAEKDKERRFAAAVAKLKFNFGK